MLSFFLFQSWLENLEVMEKEKTLPGPTQHETLASVPPPNLQQLYLKGNINWLPIPNHNHKIFYRNSSLILSLFFYSQMIKCIS